MEVQRDMGGWEGKCGNETSCPRKHRGNCVLMRLCVKEKCREGARVEEKRRGRAHIEEKRKERARVEEKRRERACVEEEDTRRPCGEEKCEGNAC